jgi:hypothetical protein
MVTFVQTQKLKPEALLLLGDNFYSAMKGGLESKRWKTGFEDMYPASTFPGPCPVVLGNHDYHDNEGGQDIQLAYAKRGNTRWTLPAKWYRLEFRQNGVEVTFLFLDTNLRSVSGRKHPLTGKPLASLTEAEETQQWAWLDAELDKPRKGFTIVVGHHPVYSNGSHGDSKELVQRLAPRLQQHGAHLYLCGHDHDLQHLELEGQRTSYILSGGGGARVRPLKNEKRKQPYGKDIYGFSHLRIQPSRMVLTHHDANGTALHRMEKNLDYTWKV